MYYTSRQQEWFNLIIYSETIVCNIPKTTFFFWSTSFTISIMLCSTCFNMSLSCRMFSSIGWGVSRGRPLNVLEPAYSNSLHEPTFFSLVIQQQTNTVKEMSKEIWMLYFSRHKQNLSLLLGNRLVHKLKKLCLHDMALFNLKNQSSLLK